MFAPQERFALLALMVLVVAQANAAPSSSSSSKDPKPIKVSPNKVDEHLVADFYGDQPHLDNPGAIGISAIIGPRTSTPAPNVANSTSSSSNSTNSTNSNPPQTTTPSPAQISQANAQLNILQTLFNRLPKAIQDQLLATPGFANGIQFLLVLGNFGQFATPGVGDPESWLGLLQQVPSHLRPLFVLDKQLQLKH